jgi:hypothetical protein
MAELVEVRGDACCRHGQTGQDQNQPHNLHDPEPTAVHRGFSEGSQKSMGEGRMVFCTAAA